MFRLHTQHPGYCHIAPQVGLRQLEVMVEPSMCLGVFGQLSGFDGAEILEMVLRSNKTKT